MFEQRKRENLGNRTVEYVCSSVVRDKRTPSFKMCVLTSRISVRYIVDLPVLRVKSATLPASTAAPRDIIGFISSICATLSKALRGLL